MIDTLLLQDKAALDFNQKERRLYFLLFLFFFSMYAPGVTWLYNVFTWIIFVYSFTFNSLAEKWMLLSKRWSILFLIFFFLVNLLSVVFSDDKKEAISWLGIRITLLVFPFALGSIFIRRLLKDRLILGYVIATAMAAAACLTYAMVRLYLTHDNSLLYNDNLSGIINLQSIYFAMLVNIALVGTGYLVITNASLLSKRTGWLIVALLLPIQFLLASRIAIIIFYVLVLAFIFYTILYQKRTAAGLALLTGLFLAMVLFIMVFPKTLNRFREMGYTKFNYGSTAKESHYNMALTPDQWNGANIRVAVWECAWTVTRQHWLLGTGLGDKMYRLKKEYARKGFVFGIQSNRNVHNTYLDVWMSLGLVGLLIFLTGVFVGPLVQYSRAKDWFGLIIVSFFVVSIFTETYLDRTVGNTMLTFFLSFIASYQMPR